MAGKPGIASANKRRRGPSTPRYKALRYAIDLRGASLRMTVLLRFEAHLVRGAENTKDRKKSQALRMTVLFGSLQDSWLDKREHERSKVTAAQDDGFVWELARLLVGYAGARKR